ncbi:hypothetical protein KP509_39G014900 [Ceratopteris richardii]|uniref:GTD-binding domain-containing protein n=1 Tax=Ceratopteris richardii TaxID=49495 RepID=A0A8T2PYL7_CERRI|nr:hypothetical protein KP509_39G014900 [Ceratopteris richardii]
MRVRSLLAPPASGLLLLLGADSTTMVFAKNLITVDHDPWKTSALASAAVELILSILLFFETCTSSSKGPASIKDSEDGDNAHSACKTGLQRVDIEGHRRRRKKQKRHTRLKSEVAIHGNEASVKDHSASQASNSGPENAILSNVQGVDEIVHVSAYFEHRGRSEGTSRRDADCGNNDATSPYRSDTLKEHVCDDEIQRIDQRLFDCISTSLRLDRNLNGGYTGVEALRDRRIDGDNEHYIAALKLRRSNYKGSHVLIEGTDNRNIHVNADGITDSLHESDTIKGQVIGKGTEFEDEDACDKGTKMLHESEARERTKPIEQLGKDCIDDSEHGITSLQHADTRSPQWPFGEQEIRGEDVRNLDTAFLYPDECFQRHSQESLDSSELSVYKSGQTREEEPTEGLLNRTSNFDVDLPGLKDNEGLIQFGSLIACANDICSAELQKSSVLLDEELPSNNPTGAYSGEEGNADAKRKERIDALKTAFLAEKLELEAELERERNAAAIATDEYMKMIQKLQKEKSSMEMQVAQIHRMSEERTSYGEQVMTTLKDILFNRERESMALEKEIEFYRKKLWQIGAIETADAHSENANLLPAGNSEHSLALIHSQLAESWSVAGPMIRPHQALSTEIKDPDWKSQRGLHPDSEGRSTSSVDQHSISQDPITDDKAPSPPWNPASNEQILPLMAKMEHPATQHRLQLAGKTLNDQMQGEAFHDLRMNEYQSEKQEQEGMHQYSGYKEADKDASGNDLRNAQSKCNTRNEDLGEIDEEFCGHLPIHDVYEVHSLSNQTQLRIDEDRLNCTLRSPDCHNSDVPPWILQEMKPEISEDSPSMSSCVVQGVYSQTKKSFDRCRSELQLKRLDTMEKHKMASGIRQVASRLKALEEDRELLRKTLESMKHRDGTQLSLLQEISGNLKELCMGSFTGAAVLEEAFIPSPSRSPAPKRRRHYTGSPRPDQTFFAATKGSIKS